MQPLDLAATIKSALESLSPAIAAKELTLETWFDQRVGMIVGDSGTAATGYLEPGEQCEQIHAQGGRIDVRLERFNSHVEISVKDSGQGISPELLPYLFDRFRQGDVNTNRTEGGLGLGLAIVKHLVEMHGGTVAASSAGQGKGAKFTVVLPIAASFDEALLAPRKPNAASEAGGGVRVLIVDDDADTCAVMSRILNETGAAVAAAVNVGAALEQLEQFDPQVLVSDIGMPERDGYDLIRGCGRAAIRTQRLPAIALTHWHVPGSAPRPARRIRVHVSKPIDASRLTAAIAALIGRVEHSWSVIPVRSAPGRAHSFRPRASARGSDLNPTVRQDPELTVGEFREREPR